MRASVTGHPITLAWKSFWGLLRAVRARRGLLLFVSVLLTSRIERSRGPADPQLTVGRGLETEIDLALQLFRSLSTDVRRKPVAGWDPRVPQ